MVLSLELQLNLRRRPSRCREENPVLNILSHRLYEYGTVYGEHEYPLWSCHVWLAFYTFLAPTGSILDLSNFWSLSGIASLAIFVLQCPLIKLQFPTELQSTLETHGLLFLVAAANYGVLHA